MKPARIFVLALLIFLTSFINSSNSIPVNAFTENSQDFLTGNVRFERLVVEDGLPHATVLSVIQDRQGFMWFATANGLARYDGTTFTTYRHDVDNPNSLSNNNTFSLIESSDGLIWIGTDPGGLNSFDPATGNFTLYKKEEGNPNSLIDNSVWSLMEARDGRIWVGTRGGLSVLDRQTGTFKNYEINPDNPRALSGAVVYRIYQDRSGTIWLGTRNGLNRFDPEPMILQYLPIIQMIRKVSATIMYGPCLKTAGGTSGWAHAARASIFLTEKRENLKPIGINLVIHKR